jgi:NAD(P)-dependent dehydrogenase (short-subunit alcohol dehydrogenase family)
VVVADLGGELKGTGSSSDPADQVVKEIEAAGGEAVACYSSVTDKAGAASIAEAALDSFGRLDVVINNAGIADPDWFEDLSVERFERMVEVHYLGTVYVTMAAWPHLQAQGYGRIVNTTSEAAIGTVPKATAYGGGKGGVFGFTKSLAVDAMRHGILVNAVAPRANTRLSAPAVLAHTYDLPEDTFADTMAKFEPERVSPAAAYLAHESCRLNGEILIAGGGQIMRMAVLETKGISRDDLTAEDLATNLDQVMDITDADVITTGVMGH